MQNKKDINIFKELKQRINYLKEELNYEVAFIALQGSQNYGLDLYQNDYTSDIDCIAVVLPSIDDFIDNRQPVSTTVILPNNEHIIIKDIRLYFDLLNKQNIQFTEILFTKYIIVNKKYKLLLRPLFANAEKIAKANKVNLFNCICGIALQREHALLQVYPNTQERFDKCGYDSKSLYHLIRLYQFETNLISGMSYKQSLSTFVDDYKEMCINAKLGLYTIEEAKILAEKFNNEIYSQKQSYLNNTDSQEDLDVPTLLTKIKSVILKRYFTDSLECVIISEYKLCPDQYRNVWVTSDNHFGHTNILKYEAGRLNMLGVTDADLISKISRYIIDNNLNVDNDEDYSKARAMIYAELTKRQDNEMINRWNKTVAPDDLVLILGDFSFRKSKDTETLLKELNGDKVLIKGNHDIFLEDKDFDKSLFKAIYDYKETKYKGQEIALMHYPIQEFKHMDREISPAVLLFGHIHSGRVMIPKHSFNVGVDVNNYAPVNIKDAIKQALENNGGKINNV